MESSLSKKNGVEITAGAGVNPVSPSKKFKKLQLLDRKISKIDKLIRLITFDIRLYQQIEARWRQVDKTNYNKLLEKLNKLETKKFNLDQKRKELRLTKIKK